MSVLVVDPRWPDIIPVELAAAFTGPVEYTEEVPIAIRWNLADLVQPAPGESEGWLVTTDPANPLAVERRHEGERVVTVPTLSDPLAQAHQVMHTARSRGEWEKGQTHETLIEYLEQETQELIDAIRGEHSDDALKKELADLLLQVLFHAEIADERGAFAFCDVAQAFVEKMKNRAPYLFDGSTGPVDKTEQDRLWAEGKAREKKQD